MEPWGDEVKNQPFSSWPEYEQVSCGEARLIRNFMAYRTLSGLLRGVFYDETVYEEFKEKLGGGDKWMSNSGVILFEQYQRAKPQPRAASDEALPQKVQTRIDTWHTELEDWKATETEEYKKARQLIDIILEGKLGELELAKIREVLRSSLFHFTGILLAYQIATDKEQLKATPEPANRLRQGGTTARQRLEEYLKKEN